MIVQSKNQPFWFTKAGRTDILRICQLKRQILTVENDQKPVQYVAAQEDIGAVCCNAAYGREDKTFHCEANIINRTQCVSTVVTRVSKHAP